MISQDPDLLRSLQKVILMIAMDLDAFCTEHDITYYMMGGTALGAMRHEGFIPWDDDFDVFMDRTNYLKFMSKAEQFIDRDKYYVQHEGTDEWPLYFSKLRLNDTLYQELGNEDRQMHQGVFIDIMCLNNTTANRGWRYVQYSCGRFLTAYALARRGYETKSVVKKIAMVGAGVVGLAPVKAALLGIVRGLNGRATSHVGHFFGRAPFPATSFHRTFLGEPRSVPFEEESLPVPNNVEAYLTVRFGPRHMEMPSQKTRDKYPVHALDVQFGPWAPSPSTPDTGEQDAI